MKLENRSRWISSLAVLLFAPIGLFTIYLFLAGPASHRNVNLDLPALIASVLLGLVGVVLLPLSARLRLLLALIYAPGCTVVLFCHAITLVCARYRDCL